MCKGAAVVIYLLALHGKTAPGDMVVVAVQGAPPTSVAAVRAELVRVENSLHTGTVSSHRCDSRVVTFYKSAW